jgi:hypothetical protein
MVWLRWFGILLASISLFSLAQKLGKIEITPVIKDLLAFYRAAFYPIAATITDGLRWILNIASIKLPNVPEDFVIIYALVGSAFFRSVAIKLWGPITAIGAGISWPLQLFWPLKDIVFSRRLSLEIIGDLKDFGMEISKVLISFLVIFGANAYFTY